MSSPKQRAAKVLPGFVVDTLDRIVFGPRRIRVRTVQRIFPTRTVLADLLLADQDATPDGGHFSPRAHRLVGAALAAEILGWSGLPPGDPMTQRWCQSAAPDPAGALGSEVGSCRPWQRRTS